MSESPRKPELVLRRLEWTVIRRLDGVLQGNYRTMFRGSGMDLAGLREYQINDDVRHIDWNVTARLQEPYIRQYHEDREITAWFLLDVSPSVDFGSSTRQKRQVLVEATSVLARVLTRRGNRVGAMFYGDGVDTVIPAKGGRGHVLHIIDRLLKRPVLTQAATTDLGALLEAGFRTIKRRSLVFVLSDFISTPGWEKPLARMAQRHEVLALRLFDPLELEIPDLGLFTMQDSETGEQIFIDTHDRGFRKRFALAAERREVEIQRALQMAGADAIELSTEGDLADELYRFAELRKRRSQLTSGGGASRPPGGSHGIPMA